MTDAVVRLLSVNETAKQLKIGRTTIYGLMASGQLRYVRLGERRKISEAELARFAASLPQGKR